MIPFHYRDRLMKMAQEQYPDQLIIPCRGFSSFDPCFTFWKDLGQYLFWFNTAGDGSTRVVVVSGPSREALLPSSALPANQSFFC